MNNSPSLKISLILGTIIMIGTIVLFNNNSIYAKQAIWRDFDNMKDLVAAIRSGEKNDNNINWEKFQDSDIYQNEDKDSKECLQLAHKIGNNLGDYEIVHCFRDENYFKIKYTESETPEPQPETNASLNVPEPQPETNASLNVPEVPETNASEIVTPRIDLNITVGKDPITRGENQMVTVLALDPTTGKELDRVFIKLEIKDPVGILVKYYTGTEGNLTRTFKIGENATGTFIISATASQAGVQSTKSLTFQVQ
ncbi:MAG: hypothetical protein QOC37_11260 [Nitrososphaeraceae archaeon]|nr:hypothetical protein [Nitrososphaeraceae archaeon]